MRNKALKDANFPDENIINEYLVKKDNVLQLDLKWKQPDMVNFVVRNIFANLFRCIIYLFLLEPLVTFEIKFRKALNMLTYYDLTS